MTKGHNNPPVILELTAEEAAFLKTNCESNMAHGLEFLQKIGSHDLQEKLIEQIEMFKAIRAKLTP